MDKAIAGGCIFIMSFAGQKFRLSDFLEWIAFCIADQLMPTAYCKNHSF